MRSRFFLSVAAAAFVAAVDGSSAHASPYTPAAASHVLAELPPGARHVATPSRAAMRLDIALPLAQFHISRARVTGDLRFLGYAEAVLSPWLKQSPVPPQVLILDATILQSRHAFDASLVELDRALEARPDDAQAWLTRATVLRVLGRYDAALASCEHLNGVADPGIATLCTQSIRSLMGHLPEAYAVVASLPQQTLPPEAHAWRDSELGEMAERLGDDAAAERWFRAGLERAPGDFYIRAACADVLLRQGRAAETLTLLAGYEALEPMLLRVALAHRKLRDGASAQAEAVLTNAFDVEARRGDAVHRREQARFLLDVEEQPLAALQAAEENWRVQRAPDDVLILLRAAQAAERPDAQAGVLQFIQQTGLEDTRLDRYRSAT